MSLHPCCLSTAVEDKVLYNNCNTSYKPQLTLNPPSSYAEECIAVEHGFKPVGTL